MNQYSFLVRKVKYVLVLLVFFYPHFISSKTITICGASFPPSTIVENGKLVRGYSVEVIAESFSRLKLDYQLEVLPWKRCLWLVKAGDIDAVIDTSIYNEPIITGKFPISYNQLAIYVREDFPDAEYSPISLRGKLIGIPRGYTSYFNLAKENGWLGLETDDEENMFTMLEKGRFDYAFSDTSTALSMASKVNARIKPLKPVVTSQKYFLGFSPNHEALALAFDEVIEKMIQDGTMNRIYIKYLPQSYTDMHNNSLVSFQ